MRFDNILIKIGGIDTSIKNNDNAYEDYEKGKMDLILLEKFDTNSSFRQFMSEYPPFQFKKNVAFRNTNTELLNSMKEEFLNVSIFYSLSNNSNYSISKELDLLNDQIPKSLLPFCSDGFSGDFFCIGLEKENYGKIFYFWHEGPNERFFKVCDSFDIFLELLVNFDMPIGDFYDEENSTPPKGDFQETLLEWKKKHGLN